MYSQSQQATFSSPALAALRRRVTGAHAQTPDTREDAHRHAELRARATRPRRPRESFTTRWTSSAPFRPSCGPFRPFRSNRSGLALKRDLGADLQRSGHRRQLRRPQGRLAHGQRHHDLRHGERRSQPGTGRPRGPGRAGCRPDRRLLAARDHRLRPARSRQGQGRQVSSPAARLHRRGSQGGLLRPAGHDEQLQRHGPRPRGEQRHRRPP